tara:strand:+ start:1510 stop:1923 length:414 start_codon:yes stop_codon:yes gene_type:complete
MSEEFDADAILNDSITDAEYEGKRPMTPEGAYPESTITEVRAFEPHEKSKEKGVEARLLITFDCSNSDIDLSTWVNYKRPLNARATYAKLLKAVWPDADAARGKTPRDLIGETVNVNVFHEDGDFGEWAEFRFTPFN